MTATVKLNKSMGSIAQAIRDTVDFEPEPANDVTVPSKLETQESEIPEAQQFRRSDSLAGIGLMTYRQPAKTLTQEKAWMRTAAYLMAKGNMTQHEIALAVGKTDSTVSLLMTQPSFRQTVSRIIADMGIIDDSHISMLRAAGSLASSVLISLVQNSSSDSVKLNAANSILDRVMGRPVQTVQTSKGTVPLDPSKELLQLKNETERLQRELRPNLAPASV